MCKMRTLLIPDMKYHGVIIKTEQGHVFFPFDVNLTSGGLIIPRKRENFDEVGFKRFRQILSEAMELSTSTQPSSYVEDFFGDRVDLRTRILGLNAAAGLPGFVLAATLAA